MNPKEKAKQLINKYSDATLAYDSGDHTANGINDSIMEMVNESKRCALIAASECYLEAYKQGTEISLIRQEYWQQVKTEIEKL